MTKEEKQLLLKDLCTRLPYGVMIYLHTSSDRGSTIVLNSDIYGFIVDVLNNSPYEIEEIKPYLRPMSSMTEEEKIMVICARTGKEELVVSQLSEFYNSHHFDYRGLIEKRLALEAPEGMYKIK